MEFFTVTIIYLILSIAGLLSLFTVIILAYKLVKANAVMALLKADNARECFNFETLKQEHSVCLEELYSLRTKIEIMKANEVNAETTRNMAFNAARESLVNLGDKLSSRLIDLHKKETYETRIVSEKNIQENNQKFYKELQKLLDMVAILGDKVSDSTHTVDIIKNSLLSPSGIGALAEITLENILKASGLREKADFIMQYSISNAESTRLRPDAIIFLPGDNLMIVDAKASKFLVDQEYVDSTKIAEGLKKTMNLHLKSLTSKEYAENISNDSKAKGQNLKRIITVMFLPTELSVEKLSNIDNSFLQKAWENNIFPVGPCGLMNMLSLARFQINEDMRHHNQLLILEEVKKIISSMSALAEHANKLGNGIHNLVNCYDKFAASFNHNFLSKVKNIKKLGVESNAKTHNIVLDRYHLISTKSDIIDSIAVNQETTAAIAEKQL